MKKLCLFILLTISFILLSCKKDGEIKLTNNICLKLSENDQFYEYDELNRIMDIHYINSDGKKDIIKSYSYSGDSIIKKYQVPGQGSGSFVTEKSVLGKNGFIEKTFYKIYNFETGTRVYSDSNIYNDYKFLTKTISSIGFTTYFFYEINGNLKEEWNVNGVDSFLSKKYEYDLLNENKEASWIEWVEKKGKANKHLVLKQIDGDYLYVYSYSLKNGYPIKKQILTNDKFGNYIDLYETNWSCLQ